MYSTSNATLENFWLHCGKPVWFSVRHTRLTYEFSPHFSNSKHESQISCLLISFCKYVINTNMGQKSQKFCLFGKVLLFYVLDSLTYSCLHYNSRPSDMFARANLDLNLQRRCIICQKSYVKLWFSL